MMIKVVLVDVNPKMVAAWRETFEDNPEVEIAHGSMLDQSVSAWVSPTNSAGRMDGGLDAVIKGYLGGTIEHAVQKQIAQLYSGAMPVGHATCVATGRTQPRYLISTPTMISSSEDVSDTMNVALAAAAAFQAVHMQNAREPGSIRSVALPGLGANTGRVPVEICADLMWTAYDLFREAQFKDFPTMRMALEGLLGDLGPTSTKGAFKKSFAGHAGGPKQTIPDHAAAQAQLKKKIEKSQKDALDEGADVGDFDDSEDFGDDE
ncbi:MAG: macro domain-containing protein [Sandaracinaceae bacterium]|nr:macro domain-containing protein [Sandaracinaceae bacterium]